MSSKKETTPALSGEKRVQTAKPKGVDPLDHEVSEHVALVVPESVNDDMERCDATKVQRPLALKMAKIMASVRHVPKRGRHDFLNYNYITESDLIESLRGKLAAQGVALFPSIKDHTVRQVSDSRGRPQHLATVTLELTFVDGDSGDQKTTVWVGQGMDAGDKSYYKAYTSAFRYALLKTFMITGGEKEDTEDRDAMARPRRAGVSGGRRRA